MERKSTASIAIFSLLYVARRIGTEDFPVMSHCVHEQGCDAVRKGNVSRPSSMKSEYSFQPGTAASLASKQSNKERKSSFSCCTHTLPKRTVSAGRSRCYCQWGGRRGWKHSSQEKQPQTEHYSRLSHIGCCSQEDISCFAVCHLMLGTEVSFPFSLLFSSQREPPWEGVVPLRQ